MAEDGFEIPQNQMGSQQISLSAMSFFRAKAFRLFGHVRLYSMIGHIESEAKVE